jgi:precorrin isomerase
MREQARRKITALESRAVRVARSATFSAVRHRAVHAVGDLLVRKLVVVVDRLLQASNSALSVAVNCS